MKKYEYLKWCVELTNSDLSNTESVRKLSERAIQEEFFLPFPNELEIVEWRITNEGPALQENVKAFATAVTNQLPFSVIINKEINKQFNVHDERCWMTLEHPTGTVKFHQKNIQKISDNEKEIQEIKLSTIAARMEIINEKDWILEMLGQWEDAKNRIAGNIKDLPLNYMVDRFYESLNQYSTEKKCRIKDLPFKNCKLDTCGRPFLGRLKRQEFCKKRHGEIYHSKKAYRKKIGLK